MYWDFSISQMLPMREYGNYYTEITKNPHLYIKQRPEIIELLQNLRKKGKKIFLNTNSHYDYSDFTMSTAFGPNWRDYFDIIISCGRKPEFFKSNEQKFKIANIKECMFHGCEAKIPLKEKSEYVLGNYKDLEITFENSLGKTNLKYVYLGDNYVSDCFWPPKLKDWDSIAIIEELASIFFFENLKNRGRKRKER